MHHPLPTSLMNEEPDLKYPDIVTLLSSFDNVKLVLTGHYHKVRGRATWASHSEAVLGACFAQLRG